MALKIASSKELQEKYEKLKKQSENESKELPKAEKVKGDMRPKKMPQNNAKRNSTTDRDEFTAKIKEIRSYIEATDLGIKKVLQHMASIDPELWAYSCKYVPRENASERQKEGYYVNFKKLDIQCFGENNIIAKKQVLKAICGLMSSASKNGKTDLNGDTDKSSEDGISPVEDVPPNHSKTNEERNEIIISNLKLVHEVIMIEYPSHKDNEDAFQDGCIGLIEATDAWLEEMRTPFFIFAYPWIKDEICHSLKNQARPQRNLLTEELLSTKSEMENATQRERSIDIGDQAESTITADRLICTDSAYDSEYKQMFFSFIRGEINSEKYYAFLELDIKDLKRYHAFQNEYPYEAEIILIILSIIELKTKIANAHLPIKRVKRRNWMLNQFQDELRKRLVLYAQKSGNILLSSSYPADSDNDVYKIDGTNYSAVNSLYPTM